MLRTVRLFQLTIKPRFAPVAFYASKKGAKQSKQVQEVDEPPFDMTPFITRMDKSLEAFKTSLEKIRVGRANPNILDPIMVELDNKRMPLSQVAQIHVKDANTLMVVVPDEKLTAVVERSMKTANLSLNPQKQDNLTLKVPIPKMTAEYKQSLVKQIHSNAEKSKIGIRNIRQDARKIIKKDKSKDVVKRNEDAVQKKTDDFIKKIDDLMAAKEKELSQ
ncbi:hypothetical protein HK103_007330 [Boothiomyces macroporosus]|uniref:Ribosome recycling factor domain-containing protein n=1 Tax=Boothiomyces macroporosus TaxID=261099 RepID=A0AAD5Y620_9FUNG|nr:hypothetical protein HK103_007330 [Boothiomyces macroporosus]